MARKALLLVPLTDGNFAAAAAESADSRAHQ